MSARMDTAGATAPDAEPDERWRLFVALPVAAAARERLHAQLQPYRRTFPEARWLDPASWHVTLLFLGHVHAVRVPDLDAACTAVASRWPRFDIDVARGGGRPRRDEGVAWLRVRTGARGVLELAEDLDRAVQKAVAGDAAPRRAPSAHVTVARRADGTLTRALEDELLGGLAAGWRVEDVHLVRSHLGREGARYEVVGAAPLSGG
jgi:RNA 2',3'-cyclic 3'-phosphodiesterase